MVKTYTGHLLMFCMITNIYNKKTKGPTLMELFTATGKLVINVCNHAEHYEMPCITAMWTV
jgi:hypothetical protein